MLTGTRPFPGEDVTDTLAAVLRQDLPLSALPASTPPRLARLIGRCLERDPKQRLRDIGEARIALAEAERELALGPEAATTEAAQRAVTRVARWRRVAATTAGALAVAAVTGAAVYVATRPADPVPLRVSRLSLALSPATALTTNNSDRDLAIAPDGSRVVYVGNNGTQLFVRALDALEPVAVFTGMPRGPFFSPDGQWIGFTDGGTVLKKVAVTGGPPVTIASVGNAARGATWGPEDSIIFATNSSTDGLQRTSSAGGPVTVLTRPDRAKGETFHLWPEMLPGGRAVLFTITPFNGGLDAAQLAVLDLQTGSQQVLLRGGSHAHFVPGRPGPTTGATRDGGYLIYAAGGAMRAVAFDLATLKTSGTPVPVVPNVVTTTYGGLDAVVASDGTLAYVSGSGGGAHANAGLG